jgi:hypothetical protein
MVSVGEARHGRLGQAGAPGDLAVAEQAVGRRERTQDLEAARQSGDEFRSASAARAPGGRRMSRMSCPAYRVIDAEPTHAWRLTSMITTPPFVNVAEFRTAERRGRRESALVRNVRERNGAIRDALVAAGRA